MEQWRKQTSKPQVAFTIVELLIVIVVIAILATLTIVAYNGIQNGAKASSLQSDLSQAAKLLETSKIKTPGETYPANLATAESTAGIKASSGNTYTYYNNSDSNDYCLESTNSNITYSISSTSTSPTVGPCTENSLVGWWKMNGNADDSTTNGNDGVVNSVNLTVGQNGQSNSAYDFTALGHITSTTSTQVSPMRQTISFWIKPRAWTSSTASAFLTKRAGSNGFFVFYLNSTSQLTYDCGGSSGSGRWGIGYTPQLNQWTNIVISCSSSVRYAYANGAFLSSVGGGQTALLDNAAALTLGSDSSGGYPYDGAMDDVRIYNRILSSDEIFSLYSSGAQ